MYKLGLAFSAALVSGQQAANLAEYCTALESQCGSVFGINASVCMTAFGNVEVGNLNQTNMNTIGCRQKFLTVSEFKTNSSCQFAGATGGGRCGAVLDGVCQVATTICQGQNPSYADVASCKTGLDPIAFQWGTRQGALASGENSLECRAYHALASAVTGDNSHCTHFNLSNSPCSGTVATDAAVYCDNLQYQCTGSNAQFNSKADCLVVAAGYPSTGSAEGSNTANSLGCRQYHAQAALANANIHCQHAGPSGGHACGTPRDAWASILAASPCNTSSIKLFLAAVNTTTIDNLIPVGISPTPYSAPSTGNTQACRIYHATVAANAISHCAHAGLSGGDQCGNYVPNLCSFIGQTCGFGTNASYQFTDNAACTSALTNVTAGTIGDTSNNTIECRFYHAGVAATYGPGGAQEKTMDAESQRRLHCSHVLKNSGPGGCGFKALTPTPAAANSAVKASFGISAIIVLATLV